jgi:hypothetical protein
MFSFKNKIEPNLKLWIDNKTYKTYRVNIFCKSLINSIEKKVKSFRGSIERYIPSANILCAIVSPHAIQRLLELPEIDYICLDTFAFLCGSSSVLSANGINFREKHKFTGKGVGVALIDSGVYPHHDLQNPNKIHGFFDLLNDAHHPYDDNGHGTFMAGIICGNGASSKGLYPGVAPNSHIYAVKAFNSIGRAFCSDILFAIENVLDNAKEYNIKILCLPFEIMDYNYKLLNGFSKLFDKCIQNDIIPIVPTGSKENKECSIVGISTLPNCLTVGGIDTTSSPIPYKFSSCGPCGKVEKPDLSAACVNICSLNCNTSYVSERNGVKLFAPVLDRPYTNYTGTSCAAAYISGLCAMLLQSNSRLAFKDVVSLLKISSSLIDAPKWSQGHGLVDIEKLIP